MIGADAAPMIADFGLSVQLQTTLTAAVALVRFRAVEVPLVGSVARVMDTAFGVEAIGEGEAVLTCPIPCLMFGYLD